ncbi:hypothetical protein HGRIS_004119 [Hohenbuehelia grisea]|uniref:DUF6534 domain-containing protein n=1 Tax=Hohenbuehelia grisea TaxID=104357 RepID=A0ABR3JHM4_9AGAR
MIIAVVQSAYTLRVWHRMSLHSTHRKKIIIRSLVSGRSTAKATFLTFPILGAFVMGLLLSLPVKNDTSFPGPSFPPTSFFGFFNPKFRMIQMGLSSLADILITSSLVFHLRTGYSQTESFLNTKHLLDYIIAYSIATGLVTSLLSLSGVVFFALNMKLFQDFFNGFRVKPLCQSELHSLIRARLRE